MAQANLVQAQKQLKESQAQVTTVDAQRKAALIQGGRDANRATSAEAKLKEAQEYGWSEKYRADKAEAKIKCYQENYVLVPCRS